MTDLFTPPVTGADLEGIRRDYLSEEPGLEAADLRLGDLVAEVERLREIIRLTAELRQVQRAYFASKSTEALRRAKVLERALDQQLSEIVFKPQREG